MGRIAGGISRVALWAVICLAVAGVACAEPYTTIKMRRDTTANWNAYNPVLAQGEPACEMTGVPLRCTAQKVGDGVTAWSALPYFKTPGDTSISSNANVELPTAIGLPYVAPTFIVNTPGAGVTTPQNGIVSQAVSGTDTLTTRPDSVWPGGIPDQTKVSAFLAGYQGHHSAAFHNVVNPLLMMSPRDHGVVNTNGTAVTWVSSSLHSDGSHPQFRTDWQNGGITINGVPYKIASVADATHLTLTTSAGVQSGVPYTSGNGGTAVEIDVNESEDLNQGTGLVVASGGSNHPNIGIAINAAFSEGASWNNPLVIGGYRRDGLFIFGPTDPSARGMYVENGATGGAEIKYGGSDTSAVLTLSGSNKNMLRFSPSDDSEAVVMYGTNAAGSAVKWSISKLGHAIFSSAETGTVNAGRILAGADDDGVNRMQIKGVTRHTPNSDAPGTVALYGTNAAGDVTQWAIEGGGAASFVSLSSPTGQWSIGTNGTAALGGGSANHAICWKADGKTLGYCSAVVAADGTCGTCN